MNVISRLRKLLTILSVRSWRVAFLRHGVAAGTEHASVLVNLGPVGSVVDIGANRGQFALAARHCFPQSSIISFEPLPEPAKVYLKVFDADSQTILRQVAIGPSRGETLIHISARDDSSSLLPISAEQERVFPGTHGVGTARITVTTLDENLVPADLHAPAFLKLDVQGFELDALRGCEGFLERFQWVYVECSFRELYEGQASADEVIAWLRQRGLVVQGLYNPSYDKQGRAVQADFLFARTKQS